MFVDRNLKKDAALVASVPKTTIRRNAVRTAIKRLQALPTPSRWPLAEWRLRKREFDEFRAISRRILVGETPSDGDVLRLQMYAAMIFETIDHAERDEGFAIAAE
ncbi:hypothetical protein ROJ8625_02715 [Roseivivax jejudonensis]|uniref:Uncharacterized protein n=1 Tax=Roseivivax jejudonensis TaxID=1529041 RepID=A0A1X6ZJY0_9RHOB|nr:hypothetical protein [Roseivivax jejudonensis]SLN53223.1 hypothetical protein ROJ8625_02715 [Roseivivax jejudonensis]